MAKLVGPLHLSDSGMDWDGLKHAYGSASDVPALLAAAEEAPASTTYRDEPWYSLWSALCHQGDVYSASLAAVPELVAIAARRQADLRASTECLLLAGTIEMERHKEDAPAIPPTLLSRYEDALIRGARLAADALSRTDDADQRETLSLSLAAFSGDITEARRIADGEDDDRDCSV